MKKPGKIFSIITALFLMFMILPVRATEENLSSLVVHFDLGTGIDMAAVGELYFVADYNREESNFTIAEPFDKYQVSINNPDEDDWRSLATTLAMYAERDGISPSKTSSMDENENISFSECEDGLYLFVADQFSVGNIQYTPQPFLIVLPEYDADTGTAVYQVKAEGKFEKEEVAEELTSLSVIKVWTGDDESHRPDSITVQLIGDGVVQEETELSKENNWRWTFENLSTDVVWTIVEKDVPENYTVRIEKEDKTYVINNTAEEETPEEPDLPQTGMFLWPVPLLAGAGLILLIAGVYRKKHEKG